MNLKIDLKEAKRCLNCKIPKCVEACPIHNRIPEFIAKIKEGNYEEAYQIISSVNPFGSICGRICPHESQCQGSCVRGIKNEPISIGNLEAAICDWARENKIKMKNNIIENGKKVAMIGGGPASIACAVELRKLGYDVTIFERENFLGGILMYGIPEYRLSKQLVVDVINNLLELGIKVQYNTILKRENNVQSKNQSGRVRKNCEVENDTIVGQNVITIQSLFEENYQAIFLGIGSEISNILFIEGSDKEGVLGANEFLRNDRNCHGKKVIVIGGGNVAMDAARIAKKECADVTIVYRRLKENMPANKDEIEAAEQEKIEFIFQTNVIKICGEEKVTQIECDTGKIIEADIVVMAIGSTPNVNYIDNNLKLTDQGLIEVNENYETNIDNVFAGGDLVQKKATVCMAIKNGKEAAKAINKKLIMRENMF